MSPLWRDRFCVSLAPGRVALLRFARGWEPKLVRSDVLSDDFGADDLSGMAPIKLLATMLAQEKPGFADANVVLSNHFVRYMVLPWSAEAVDDRDWQALAQHQFRVVYGDAALEWVTAVQWQGPGRPVLACASPRVLIDGLKETLRAARLRLGSLSPYFVAAFNFCRPRLPQDGFWFGVVEPGRFSFGGVESGGWASIASRRVGTDGAPRLTQTLEQEVLGGDSATERGPAFIFSPEQPIAAEENDETWSLEFLSLGDRVPVLADGRLAAALTALA
ncbi:MAG: hypothetical protein ABW205_04495 [Burkholderiales bacterium]